MDTHSYRLSPLGPALQFGGGSKVISPNSFWILLADVLSDFDIFGVPFSLFALSGVSLFALELLPASLDICKISFVDTSEHSGQHGFPK